MPNWCSNRVTVYSRGENVTKDIQKIKEIFESKDTVFGKVIPQPDWKNTPNKNGELPKLHTEYAKDGSVLFSYYHFPDGTNDQRWYDWNLENWDTKWDVAGNVEIEEQDEECIVIEFQTAWSPPESVCHKLRDMFPEVGFQWFYDEPGMEFAGYL